MIALVFLLACGADPDSATAAGTPSGTSAGTPAGTPASRWTQVLTDDIWPRGASDQHHPTHTVAADGSSAILWDDESDTHRVAIRTFGSDGLALSDPQVLGEVGSAYSRPDAIPVPGGYLATWHTRLDVFLGKTDATGQLLGSAAQVNVVRGVDPDKGQPDITRLADGSALLVYHFADPDADPISTYYTRRYDTDLQPLTDEIPIAVSTEIGSPPDVVAMPDGGYLIAWSTRTISQATIQLSRYDADGLELWTQRADQAPEYETASRPNLAIAGDAFAVAWRVQSPAAEGLGAYGRIYDLDGTPRTEPFLLPTSSQRGNVSAGPGFFLFTWEPPGAPNLLAQSIDALTGDPLEEPWAPLPGNAVQKHGSSSFHDGRVLFTADAGSAGSRALVRAIWTVEME